MDYTSWGIKPEDFEEPYYRIADAFDVDTAINLAEALKGSQIRFKTYHFNVEYYPEIVKSVGTARCLEIGKLFYGECVYFSDVGHSLRGFIKKRIREEFNGYNYKELSEKYGRSVRACLLSFYSRILINICLPTNEQKQ